MGHAIAVIPAHLAVVHAQPEVQAGHARRPALLGDDPARGRSCRTCRSPGRLPRSSLARRALVQALGDRLRSPRPVARKMWPRSSVDLQRAHVLAAVELGPDVVRLDAVEVDHGQPTAPWRARLSARSSPAPRPHTVILACGQPLERLGAPDTGSRADTARSSARPPGPCGTEPASATRTMPAAYPAAQPARIPGPRRPQTDRPPGAGSVGHMMHSSGLPNSRAPGSAWSARRAAGRGPAPGGWVCQNPATSPSRSSRPSAQAPVGLDRGGPSRRT